MKRLKRSLKKKVGCEDPTIEKQPMGEIYLFHIDAHFSYGDSFCCIDGWDINLFGLYS